jgi:hypothetical protein
MHREGRMRLTVLALALCLAGCVARYEPITLEIHDSTQYAADLKFCQAAGAAYTPKASAADIAQATFEGGAGSISYAPINPLIPALGALGGTARAASNASGFDLTGQAKTNVARHCLTDKLSFDHAAIIARPEN